jgi:hypothetical protein
MNAFRNIGEYGCLFQLKSADFTLPKNVGFMFAYYNRFMWLSSRTALLQSLKERLNSTEATMKS